MKGASAGDLNVPPLALAPVPSSPRSIGRCCCPASRPSPCARPQVGGRHGRVYLILMLMGFRGWLRRHRGRCRRGHAAPPAPTPRRLGGGCVTTLSNMLAIRLPASMRVSSFPPPSSTPGLGMGTALLHGYVLVGRAMRLAHRKPPTPFQQASRWSPSCPSRTAAPTLPQPATFASTAREVRTGGYIRPRRKKAPRGEQSAMPR